MTLLRTYSIVLFAGIVLYTIFTIRLEGPDFITPFLTNILNVGWSGQFNLDFLGYLIFAAFWIAWRHRFSGSGLLLAALNLSGGLLFFAPYMLFVISRSGGDISALVLGEQARGNPTGN